MTIHERADEQKQFEKAKKLHEQLESSGAYEKIPDRRGAQLLRAYLPTQATMKEVSQTLEKPVSAARVSLILRRGMRQAFPYLDEQTRQEYGTPDAALQERTHASRLPNIMKASAIIAQSHREGTYAGKKPLGGRREPGPGKTIGRPRRVR
jgi:hypothetical protein